MDTGCKEVGPAAEVASAAWTDLEGRVTTALERLRKDQYLVLDWPGRHRFVQFGADGEGALRAEAVSDAYLLADEKFDSDQQLALPAAGWHAPTHDPDAPASDVVAGGSPNFFVDFESRANFLGAARLAVHTLRDIFRVPSPRDLEFHAFQGGVGLVDIDACFDQVCRRREPAPQAGQRQDDYDQRLALLCAVRTATRIPDLQPKADGVIALGLGGRTVYVVWLSDLGLVLVRSTLLMGVERTKQLLETLDDLNDRTTWVRFGWRAQTVYADLFMPAPPFDPDRVRQALQHFAAAIDGLDEPLQLAAFSDLSDDSSTSSRRLQ